MCLTTVTGADMIRKEDINRIAEECRTEGCDVKIRDIAYLLLERHFEDKGIAYKVVFGTDADDKEIERYSGSRNIKVLKGKMEKGGMFSLSGGIESLKSGMMDITFEENKEALIKMLDKINEAVEAGELDTKDAIKAEKDIRVALNDKFRVEDKGSQQFVIVEAKFNHICEWTRKECFLQTKEYAKSQWKLYEKDEIFEELKKEYDLIPKKK